MKRKKKKRSIILKLMILAVCIYMLSTLYGLWSTLNENRAEYEKLKLQYSQETASIEELKTMLKDESNKQIIEKAARERLGYIYSDEQVFVDISGN